MIQRLREIHKRLVYILEYDLQGEDDFDAYELLMNKVMNSMRLNRNCLISKDSSVVKKNQVGKSVSILSIRFVMFMI